MKINIDGAADNPEFEDIMECIVNIANVPRGSIPMARGLGLSWGELSKVPDDLENDYAVDAVEQYGTYEPRATISEVAFEHNQATGETEATLVFEEGETDE
ncbi:MAG: hypothetical protein PHV18_04260 [Lachnospiraceae bacterium]|nr:hypothetical protein [Lachnospiraceae bacterium]